MFEWRRAQADYFRDKFSTEGLSRSDFESLLKEYEYHKRESTIRFAVILVILVINIIGYTI